MASQTERENGATVALIVVSGGSVAGFSDEKERGRLKRSRRDDFSDSGAKGLGDRNMVISLSQRDGRTVNDGRRGEAVEERLSSKLLGSIAHLEFSLEGADFEAKIGFSREAAIYKLKTFLMAMKSKQLESVIILNLITSDVYIATLFLWIS
ncbi:hypothetical protein L1887_42414 [Cichorium endivia]|nr:hypothetical protein L1887_42414 [Cichorium endivia]